MLFVPFFCISTLQSTQFIRLLYSGEIITYIKEKKVTWQIVVSLPASEPFLADMAEPRPSRRMGMATRSFMTVAFLVLVAFFHTCRQPLLSSSQKQNQ